LKLQQELREGKRSEGEKRKRYKEIRVIVSRDKVRMEKKIER
jgi:hypothetical protein